MTLAGFVCVVGWARCFGFVVPQTRCIAVSTTAVPIRSDQGLFAQTTREDAMNDPGRPLPSSASLMTSATNRQRDEFIGESVLGWYFRISWI